MVTNYPQQLTATREAATEERTGEGFLARTVSKVTQALCGLQGHDSVLHFERNRVLLRCTSCGYDSPGWEVGHNRPHVRFNGDDRRHLLSQPVMARKTA
jgi:hypothetical protein